jgi:hypothetical protein
MICFNYISVCHWRRRFANYSPTRAMRAVLEFNGAGFRERMANMVHAGAAQPFAEAVKESYSKARGLNAEVYVCEASDGALAGT